MGDGVWEQLGWRHPKSFLDFGAVDRTTVEVLAPPPGRGCRHQPIHRRRRHLRLRRKATARSTAHRGGLRPAPASDADRGPPRYLVPDGGARARRESDDPRRRFVTALVGATEPERQPWIRAQDTADQVDRRRHVREEPPCRPPQADFRGRRTRPSPWALEDGLRAASPLVGGRRLGPGPAGLSVAGPLDLVAPPVALTVGPRRSVTGAASWTSITVVVGREAAMVRNSVPSWRRRRHRRRRRPRRRRQRAPAMKAPTNKSVPRRR
ncbi:hypothetical protein HEP81_00222 [Streptomyces griseofuscus]|uniref:Uncharacterized protein n=1 Tax=Streptomyces griseofuscus TaxID=146922 RepID=A0A7H1PR79_9ACTN|nr:hypothetical protein HEP81_00222 [Streptomyces griseofuscus]